MFATSERGSDYYHQKVNTQVTSRFAERLKIGNLMKFRSFKELPDILGITGKVLS